MSPKFEVLFLEPARHFLSVLDRKSRTKILFNIDKARVSNDPELFKKLGDDVWEFRTRFAGLQYRMLAFWDKSSGRSALVIATHGFIKKTDKVSESEIDRAIALKRQYFMNK